MRMVGALVLMSLVGVAVEAGGPENQRATSRKWWQSAEVKAALSLTEEQSARIEKVFQEARSDLHDAYTEYRRREKMLDRLLAASDTTEADVVIAIDAFEAARSELSRHRTLMLFRIGRLLTPDQRERLEELQRRGRRSDNDGRRDRDDPSPGSSGR